MTAIISGHGKPSSKRIISALKSHIKEGSHIIHDGDHFHNKLIRQLKCTEEVYKANSKDPFILSTCASSAWISIAFKAISTGSSIFTEQTVTKTDGQKQNAYYVIYYFQEQDLPVRISEKSCVYFKKKTSMP